MKYLNTLWFFVYLTAFVAIVFGWWEPSPRLVAAVAAGSMLLHYTEK